MKILSICGSPRKGNSETIIYELQKLFAQKGIDNDIILLREKNIGRCHGCIEICNPAGICCQKDDVSAIIDSMCSADGVIFISPNYFQMPTGLFKDFMDRSCVIFAAKKDKLLQNKKTVVISVGADQVEKSDVCVSNIVNYYCHTIGLSVVGRKSFQTHSELKGNLNDAFTSGLNPTIGHDLSGLVSAISS